MLDYSTAYKIFNSIQLTSLNDLKMDLFQSAIRYSRIRTNWFFLSDPGTKERMDMERTFAHNSFIDDCNILSRNMEKVGEDICWRSILGQDRKTIGDFACYIHLLLGLHVR